MAFSSIEEAIKDIGQGKMVIVVDDEDRENEGDFVIAAEKVTADAINFMIINGRGLVCLPCETKRLDDLRIPVMVAHNDSKNETGFTVSIGAKHRITTGISPHDRAETIKAIVEPQTKPEDISRPGHVFPLRAKDGGVLKRAGHTEAAVDLARLAGLFPAGAICEIINDDGTMARVPQLEEIANKHGLKMITIADLIKYRRRTEKLVRRVEEVSMPTAFGYFRAIGFESLTDGSEHLALVKGEVEGKDSVLVRVHSECLTGDVFESRRCDCGNQLHEAMKMIDQAGSGVLLYIIGHEGRGIGLMNKLRAYRLQEEGDDTVEANERLGFAPDLRDYGIGAQILADLGLTSMRLMTNNPAKIVGLEGYGLRVVERVPLETKATQENRTYLQAKKDKLAHLITMDEDSKGDELSYDSI